MQGKLNYLATLHISSLSERPFAGLARDVVGQVADWGTYVDKLEIQRAATRAGTEQEFRQRVLK